MDELVSKLTRQLKSGPKSASIHSAASLAIKQAQVDFEESAKGRGLVDELDRALGQDKLTDRRVKKAASDSWGFDAQTELGCRL